MTDSASAPTVEHPSASEILVKVTFPISRHGPFSEDVGAGTTVGEVLVAAMNHFEVHNDSQFSYVLAHDGKEESNSTTVGSIAGGAKTVVFTLIKKITQG